MGRLERRGLRELRASGCGGAAAAGGSSGGATATGGGAGTAGTAGSAAAGSRAAAGGAAPKFEGSLTASRPLPSVEARFKGGEPSGGPQEPERSGSSSFALPIGLSLGSASALMLLVVLRRRSSSATRTGPARYT